MATIIINSVYEVEGEFAVAQQVLTDENGKKYIGVEGTLKCEQYFEDIQSIECDKFYAFNVAVFKEIFSTETADIVYYFQVGNFGLQEGDEE